jgi:glycosyltransferase 2 family protein
LTQKILSVAKYLLLLVIAIALLALAFRGVNLKNILNELKEVNYFWLSMSIAASLVAFVSRAHRWNMLIEPLGYYPKLKKTTYALMVGYLANLALPRLGEVTRCGSLSKAEKIPFDGLLGTVIVERLIDVLCLLALLLLTAVMEYSRLGSFLLENILHPLQEKSGNILSSYLFFLLAFIAAIAFILVYYLMKNKSKKEGAITKTQKLINGIINGLRSIGKLKNPIAFLFHTALIWFMYYLMAYLCFFALSVTSNLTWSAGLFVLVVGGMGMTAPVQGGIGAYHLLVSQGLILYGLTQEHGLAFATLLHTSQTLVVILFGGISLFLLFLGNKKSVHDYAGKNKIQTI